MEFANRHKCIEYYQSQFPNLPRYMIEMALDYDLATSKGSATSEKPMTNREKREMKRNLKLLKQKRTCTINDELKAKLEAGEPLELDCATIVKGSDYKMPPYVKGHIEVDGQDVANSAKPTIEEIKD
jgi:hypothetical protein